VWVGDANVISVSLSTATAGSSAYSLDASNDDGFQSAIVNWSNVTVLTAKGIYSVTPGMRWLRAIWPTGDSQASYTLVTRST
jgi:hypothetical protein